MHAKTKKKIYYDFNRVLIIIGFPYLTVFDSKDLILELVYEKGFIQKI